MSSSISASGPKRAAATPGRELPMAGHPTIGSAFVWAREHAGAATPASIVFDQAENRLHAQKALLALLAG